MSGMFGITNAIRNYLTKCLGAEAALKELIRGLVGRPLLHRRRLPHLGDIILKIN